MNGGIDDGDYNARLVTTNHEFASASHNLLLHDPAVACGVLFDRGDGSVRVVMSAFVAVIVGGEWIGGRSESDCFCHYATGYGRASARRSALCDASSTWTKRPLRSADMLALALIDQ